MAVRMTGFFRSVKHSPGSKPHLPRTKLEKVPRWMRVSPRTRPPSLGITVLLAVEASPLCSDIQDRRVSKGRKAPTCRRRRGVLGSSPGTAIERGRTLEQDSLSLLPARIQNRQAAPVSLYPKGCPRPFPAPLPLLKWSVTERALLTLQESPGPGWVR